ncbi:MAG: hypothetical protein ACYDC2_11715, partial [Solirubrobacteraceae bacterium]
MSAQQSPSYAAAPDPRLPRELRAPTVVRGMAPPREMLALKALVQSAYAQIRALPELFGTDVAETMRWGGLAVATLGKHFPGADAALRPIFDRIERRGPGAAMVERACVFRRIEPDGSTTIYWHMDCDDT